MYKQENQLKLEDFVFPYGKLDVENEWVRMASILPWNDIDEKYAAQFVNNGHPAHPARMALGSLLIKQRLRCSDEWVVRHVSENPYLQYFIGLHEYSDSCPFGESTLVAFRKRFNEDFLREINEMLLNFGQGDDDADGNDPDDSNSGTLLLDATCTPADIAYPQDLRLLSEAREKVDDIIDELHAANPGGNRARTYRKVARRDYLRISKKKRRTAKEMRSGIRKQLGYLYRNLGVVQQNVASGLSLSETQLERMNLLSTLYEQQQYMFENKTHSVPDRIVSISQSWVRPIVRGKAGKNVEFGAKLHLSLEGGYARIERLSFDAFNEAKDLPQIAERYHARTGHYPAEILADKIYANRDNRNFCKHHGIRLSGPPLGRPKKDDTQNKEQEYDDICRRNAVEGAFGTGKRAYGLGLIMTKLRETSCSAICLAIMTMNLVKLRCAFLQPLCQRGVLGFYFSLPMAA